MRDHPKAQREGGDIFLQTADFGSNPLILRTSAGTDHIISALGGDAAKNGTITTSASVFGGDFDPPRSSPDLAYIDCNSLGP